MGSGVTSGECTANNTVNISTEESAEWLYTPTHTLFVTVIVPVFWGAGVVTNSTFLFVLLRLPKMRSKSNILLANLALADLWQISFYAGIYLWMYLASPVLFSLPFVSSAGCMGFYAAFNVGYFSSVALVTAVSLERYIALCHPMKHLTIFSRQQAYKMVGICWMVGLVFSSSVMPGMAILNMRCLQWPDVDTFDGFPSVSAFCGPVMLWVRYYTEPLVLIPWLVIVIANIYMFVEMVRTLNKRRAIMDQAITGAHLRMLQVRKKFAIMLIINGTIFFICQTPVRLFKISQWICFVAGIPDNPLVISGNYSSWIVLVPQLTNCLVNPLIYGVTNANYRAALRQAFRCRVQPRKAPSTQQLCALVIRNSHADVGNHHHEAQTVNQL
ncbi:kappa-type opioid receptor-like [Patiria miniata]|uniref:G-protein coupled receptors family 1 profile domain-containing protein n=1 Tax=Patiria miniata TaxID=46514 RepID=A0A914AD49_PATMI|nr:kappa-type opioid receptor-like [Patiria miniata]